MVDKPPKHIFEDLLSLLGIEQKYKKILLALFENGAMTVLEIARKTALPRSSLYRYTEQLQQNEYINYIVDQYVGKYELAPLSRFKYLIKNNKSKLEEAHSLLDEIQIDLGKSAVLSQPETKVILYKGQQGIRQMVWNVLEAKTTIFGYTSHLLESYIGDRFMNRWKEEFMRLSLHGKDLLNDVYVQSWKAYYKDTSNRTRLNSEWKGWETRYVSAKDFRIPHTMDLYNDVVAIYNWHEGEVFGVEIHNENITQFQIQLFQQIWKNSKPFRALHIS